MKNVVIIGSTRGIGHGLATEFLKRNCRVIITGRSQDDVDVVVARFANEFGADNVSGTACEVTSEESLQSLWSFAKNELGPVDVWINNAGMSIGRAPLWEQPASDIEKIVDVNLTGLLLANKVAVGSMLEQGSGQVWNMEGFGSGGQTAPGMTAYGATKSGVTYVIKAMQKELKGKPVHVNTLSPGIVVTDLLVGDYDLQSEEWQKAKKFLNILGDTVETVTPFLVDGILKSTKPNDKVVWLTGMKAAGRFMTAGFNKRDLFEDYEGA